MGKTEKKESVVMEGALTVSRVAGLRDELLTVLKAADHIDLDLRRVTEIDLSMLQLFCSAHKTAVTEDKVLVMIDSSTEVAKNTAGLNGYLRQQGCSLDQNKTCLWKIKRMEK
jgi:anti-anti-sigma regulatory factor